MGASVGADSSFAASECSTISCLAFVAFVAVAAVVVVHFHSVVAVAVAVFAFVILRWATSAYRMGRMSTFP